MRKTILETVCGLRGGRPLSVDRRNSNRYRIVSFEEDGSRTMPIISVRRSDNEKTGKLLDAAFHEKGNGFYSVGSNSTITGAQRMFLWKILVAIAGRPLTEEPLLCRNPV